MGNNIMNRLDTSVNSGQRFIPSLLLILVFCVKGILLYFFSYLGRDKLYHLAALENWMEGRGWNIIHFSPDSLDTAITEPFCHWPPGYGLLLSPFYLATGRDLFWSTTLLDIAAMVGLVLVCRAILIWIGMDKKWATVFSILLALFPYEFMEESLGTDLPAVCLLLFGFYALLRLWSGKNMFRWCMLAVLGLVGASTIRYSYGPIILVLPFFLLAMAYLFTPGRSRQAWLFLGMSWVVQGLFLFLFNQHCGKPMVMVRAETGLFWENLMHWHPGAISPFINLRLLATKLDQLHVFPYQESFRMLGWVSVFVYLVLFILFLVFLFRLKLKQKTPLHFFIMLGGVLSLLIVGELTGLSLFQSPKPFLSGSSWTYIVEGRYYAFLTIFLQLLLAYAAYSAWPYTEKLRRPVRVFIFILLTGMFLSALHQIYYTGKLLIDGHTPELRERKADYAWFTQQLDSLIQTDPQKKWVVAATDAFYPLYAGIRSQKGVLSPGSFLLYNREWNNYGMIVGVHENETGGLLPLLSKRGARLIRKVNETSFYLINNNSLSADDNQFE